MTSAPPLPRAFPLVSPPDAAGFFSTLTEPLCCVVQLRHQQPGVVHQVVLDPAKIKDGLIRIGEWPGDEAAGWQYFGNISVVLVLGKATRDGNTVTVTPLG